MTQYMQMYLDKNFCDIKVSFVYFKELSGKKQILSIIVYNIEPCNKRTIDKINKAFPISSIDLDL